MTTPEDRIDQMEARLHRLEGDVHAIAKGLQSHEQDRAREHEALARRRQVGTWIRIGVFAAIALAYALYFRNVTSLM